MFYFWFKQFILIIFVWFIVKCKIKLKLKLIWMHKIVFIWMTFYFSHYPNLQIYGFDYTEKICAQNNF